MTVNHPTQNALETARAGQLEKLLGLATVAVLLLVPFNGLWERVVLLANWPAAPFLLAQALILLTLLLGSFYLGYRRHLYFIWQMTDYFLLVYLLVAVLGYFWGHQTFAKYLIGLRYSAWWFGFYFTGRIVGSKLVWWRGARIALMLVTAVAILQLVAWWIIPSTLHWLPLSVSDLAVINSDARPLALVFAGYGRGGDASIRIDVSVMFWRSNEQMAIFARPRVNYSEPAIR